MNRQPNLADDANTHDEQIIRDLAGLRDVVKRAQDDLQTAEQLHQNILNQKQFLEGVEAAARDALTAKNQCDDMANQAEKQVAEARALQEKCNHAVQEVQAKWDEIKTLFETREDLTASFREALKEFGGEKAAQALKNDLHNISESYQSFQARIAQTQRNLEQAAGRAAAECGEVIRQCAKEREKAAACASASDASAISASRQLDDMRQIVKRLEEAAGATRADLNEKLRTASMLLTETEQKSKERQAALQNIHDASSAAACRAEEFARPLPQAFRDFEQRASEQIGEVKRQADECRADLLRSHVEHKAKVEAAAAEALEPIRAAIADFERILKELDGDGLQAGDGDSPPSSVGDPRKGTDILRRLTARVDRAERTVLQSIRLEQYEEGNRDIRDRLYNLTDSLNNVHISAGEQLKEIATLKERVNSVILYVKEQAGKPRALGDQAKPGQTAAQGPESPGELGRQQSRIQGCAVWVALAMAILALIISLFHLR